MKNMKITLAVMCFALMFTACQPTPEEPVVVNKANGKLEKKIQETAAPTPTAEAEATPVPMEIVNRTFTAKDEKVEITVDAEVFIPEGNLPVVIIEPDEISIEFIERAAEVLLEGKALYEPRTQLTKAEIEEKILNLRKALANPEQSKSDGLRSGDPDTVAEVTKMFEDRIKIYQGMYDAAPDEYTAKKAVLEFQPSKYYENEQRYKENVAEWSDDDDPEAKQLLRRFDEEMMIVLDADLSNGYYGRITANNFTGDLSRWNSMRFIKSLSLNENTFEPSFERYSESGATTLSEEQAREKMEKLLTELGIDDMAMTLIYPYTNREWDDDWNLISETVIGYTAVFQRQYQGITAVNNRNVFYTINAEHYRPRYLREEIDITMYGDEIVTLNWQNPVKTVVIENENVATLPFDEIMDIFEQQMSLMYNVEKISRDAPENDRHEELIKNIEKGYINITKIILGMERIPVANDINRYRMVPVWRFCGREWMDIKGREEIASNMPAEEMVYLVLNAIDGSIVDYQPGY